MEADSIFLTALFATPIPIAFYVGRRCRSRFSNRVLQFGSTIFAFLLTAAVLFLISCEGNLLYGMGNCGPWDYDPPDAVQAATVLVFVAYVTVGPVLAIIALVVEALFRRRRPGLSGEVSDETDSAN